MRTATTWGGQMEIQAFSLLHKVNVTIHQLESPRWEIKNFGSEVRTVHLSYHDVQENIRMILIVEGTTLQFCKKIR